ncbi:MAG TPA: protein kinase [Kofleriaceae bacterium]|nr:protein kinase [Kofleriaceae bacterium]
MTVQGEGGSGRRLGRYHLAESLGAGPTGEVFRAKVIGVAGFERQFAVKRFHPQMVSDADRAGLLAQASRGYGALQHPRIARLHEFGVAAPETFVATELVRGLDLHRLLARAGARGAGLPSGAGVGLIAATARALGFAHSRGLSHLGLSPTNVLCTVDGDIKVTDFGHLSHRLSTRPAEDPGLAPRLAYLAPEQLRGDAGTPATDVFQLGLLACELLTGQSPLAGADPREVQRRALSGELPVVALDLPRPLVQVIRRALAVAPADRFPEAGALADALDAAARATALAGDRRDLAAVVRAAVDEQVAVEDRRPGVPGGPIGAGGAVPPPSARSAPPSIGRMTLTGNPAPRSAPARGPGRIGGRPEAVAAAAPRPPVLPERAETSEEPTRVRDEEQDGPPTRVMPDHMVRTLIGQPSPASSTSMTVPTSPSPASSSSLTVPASPVSGGGPNAGPGSNGAGAQGRGPAPLVGGEDARKTRRRQAHAAGDHDRETRPREASSRQGTPDPFEREGTDGDFYAQETVTQLRDELAPATSAPRAAEAGRAAGPPRSPLAGSLRPAGDSGARPAPRGSLAGSLRSAAEAARPEGRGSLAGSLRSATEAPPRPDGPPRFSAENGPRSTATALRSAGSDQVRAEAHPSPSGAMRPGPEAGARPGPGGRRPGLEVIRRADSGTPLPEVHSPPPDVLTPMPELAEMLAMTEPPVQPRSALSTLPSASPPPPKGSTGGLAARPVGDPARDPRQGADPRLVRTTGAPAARPAGGQARDARQSSDPRLAGPAMRPPPMSPGAAPPPMRQPGMAAGMVPPPSPQRMSPPMPPQGRPSQGMPSHGMPSHGGPPQGMPPQGMPPQGMPSHGGPPQGPPSHGMPPQGMPPQGMSARGMPPQGPPSLGMPPQRSSQPGPGPFSSPTPGGMPPTSPPPMSPGMGPAPSWQPAGSPVEPDPRFVIDPGSLPEPRIRAPRPALVDSGVPTGQPLPPARLERARISGSPDTGEVLIGGHGRIERAETSPRSPENGPRRRRRGLRTALFALLLLTLAGGGYFGYLALYLERADERASAGQPGDPDATGATAAAGSTTPTGSTTTGAKGSTTAGTTGSTTADSTGSLTAGTTESTTAGTAGTAGARRPGSPSARSTAPSRPSTGEPPGGRGEPPDKLTVDSRPARARVYLDGAVVGRTPLTLESSADRHKLAIIAPGYKPHIAEIDGRGSVSVTLEEVTPSNGPAGIKIRCRQKNRYYVTLDGEPTGQLCPTERLGVELGDHTAEIYDPVTDSRRAYKVHVDQTRLSHRVRVD